MARKKPKKDELAEMDRLFPFWRTEMFGMNVPTLKAEDIKAAYCDAGCIGKNPSKDGGAWAYCFVGKDDNLLVWASRILPVSTSDGGTLSNNVGELFAAVMAIQAMPPGTQCELWTDSIITMWRVSDPRITKFKGVPPHLKDRVVALRREQPNYRARLIRGHPELKDWHKARNDKGEPVSKWNVLCDFLCTARITEFEAQRKAGA